MQPIIDVSSTSPFIVRLAASAYDKLIQQPVAGLANLVGGAVQTVGPLLRATVHAVVETVRSFLTTSDAEAIEHGIERMSLGAALLVWPLAVLGTVLFWRQPLLQTLLAIGLFGLALN
ncbi:MAG: hypothetical protein JNM56_09125 [Planctomycetia bacterium]|nr:hypothetical protein [Planctomycetia bacterium]